MNSEKLGKGKIKLCKGNGEFLFYIKVCFLVDRSCLLLLLLFPLHVKFMKSITTEVMDTIYY